MHKNLHTILGNAQVMLEPLAPQHYEELRLACAEDQEIWDIYPNSMLGEHFDKAIAGMSEAQNRAVFAVINNDPNTGKKVVGMTSYINPDQQGVVEIGGTYISPAVRGTDFNLNMKRLLIEHGFSCGYRRIEFRVDVRNKRSQKAVLKLGAKQDGILRENKITWTGHIRDTAVFSIFQDEWQATHGNA
jgi:RimJ/RimL family protein N-acetyltransferase